MRSSNAGDKVSVEASRGKSGGTKSTGTSERNLVVTRRSMLKAAGAMSAGASLAVAGERPPFQVGQFLLWLNQKSALPGLKIAHTSEPQRMLWQSLPASSFLIGGYAETVIEENDTPASGFTINDKNLVRYETQTVQSAGIRSGALELSGTLEGMGLAFGYKMTWSAAGPDQLRFAVEFTGPNAGKLNRIFLRYASSPDERFFGFGQQMTYFDQKGRLLPILVQEHGVGRGMPIITQLVSLKLGPRSAGSWYTTEVSVPQYITSQQRSLFLETTEYCVFDLRHPSQVEIEIFASAASGQVLHGQSALDLIGTYTSYSGRMRELPDWVHDGAIICLEGGTNLTKSLINQFVDTKVAVSALWFQDWTGQNPTSAGIQVWWNWQMDTQLYSDWQGLRQLISDRLGARVLLYVNPFLTTQDHHNDLFEYAANAQYLVKNQTGDPYLIKNTFSAGLVDLTNREAFEWLKGIIKDRLITQAGASGWMGDFGEGLSFDAVLSSGESPAVWHNRYPMEWQRLQREAIEETGHGSDALFFNRSGYSQSPGVSTLFWVGDQLQDWNSYDGLKSAITGCLSGGVSGFSLVHSDVGGYDSIPLPIGEISFKLVARTRELLLRWAEFGAFSPVMRTHVGIDPGIVPQVYSDPATLSAFARCVNMYRAWSPYRKKLVAEAAVTGHPVMRHLILQYPDVPVEGLQYQYLLGTDILVCPVTEAHATIATVFIPEGGWMHIWSGETFTSRSGTYLDITAPIGQPPVFLRVGSLMWGVLEEAFRHI
jgi:alpha-glucosidase